MFECVNFVLKAALGCDAATLRKPSLTIKKQMSATWCSSFTESVRRWTPGASLANVLSKWSHALCIIIALIYVHIRFKLMFSV